ncbi:MAG: M20/M25/M40 family metallo-hydrolase [Anaerolineae bacterium]|nr:M20/M25/M40 family metallo-hydrolase [Anaerolineae bacterium]
MDRLLRAAEVEADGLVSFARRLVQTPSLSGQEEEVAGLVETEMRALGYDEVRRDEAGNVIGRLRGSGGGRTVLLNGHMDTVDPGPLSAWAHPPYAAELVDGRLHGRGAADMKGPLAAQVYCVALLGRAGLQPEGDVVVTAVVQEETGGLGTQFLLQGGANADCAIVGEASGLELRRGHRGRLELVVTVQGRSVHASAPERGANPHYTLAGFVQRLRQLELPTDPDLGGASVAPTLCSGDQTSSNVIPGRLVLRLDYRTLPGEKPEDIVARFQSLLDQSATDGCSGKVEIERHLTATYTGWEKVVLNAFPAFILPADAPELRAARSALARLTGEEPKVGLWRFSTDGGHLVQAGIPTIGYGPGEETLVHTVNESIAVDDLVRGAAGYAALCLALSQPETAW